MDVNEVIRTRRSIRKYKADPISDEILTKVLEAARLAPSANNEQPWKFIIVRDERMKQNLVSACRDQSFIAEAPLVIVACGLPNKSHIGGYTSSVQVDVAIALDHLTLAAWAEGLGTCWIGAFYEKMVKRLLSIPNDVKVIALTPLGYPMEIPEKKPRKYLAEIICYDKFD
jgi:nitroreductase